MDGQKRTVGTWQECQQRCIQVRDSTLGSSESRGMLATSYHLMRHGASCCVLHRERRAPHIALLCFVERFPVAVISVGGKMAAVAFRTRQQCSHVLQWMLRNPEKPLKPAVVDLREDAARMNMRRRRAAKHMGSYPDHPPAAQAICIRIALPKARTTPA